jgi:hypothetical protein
LRTDKKHIPPPRSGGEKQSKSTSVPVVNRDTCASLDSHYKENKVTARSFASDGGLHLYQSQEEEPIALPPEGGEKGGGAMELIIELCIMVASIVFVVKMFCKILLENVNRTKKKVFFLLFPLLIFVIMYVIMGLADGQ